MTVDCIVHLDGFEKIDRRRNRNDSRNNALLWVPGKYVALDVVLGLVDCLESTLCIVSQHSTPSHAVFL